MQDLLGRLRRGRRRERARRRALRRRRVRDRPPRARALLRRGRPSISRTWSGTSTSRSPTSRRSGSSRSRELAAKHVTVALSGQGADELLGGYRKHRSGRRSSARGSAAGAASRGCGRTGRAAWRRAGSRAPRCTLAGTRPGRPSARDERPRRAPAAESPRARAARRARRQRSPRDLVAGGSNGVPDDPLPATLYIDAPARARRRHAPLLRPRVDGALARGARAVPRPSVSSSSAPRSPPTSRCRRGTTKYVLKRGRARADPGSDHRQAEGRLLQRVRSTGGSRRRPTVRSTTTSCARIRATRSSSTAAEVERLVKSHDPSAGKQDYPLLLSILMLEVWLATFVERAQRTVDPPQRERISVAG